MPAQLDPASLMLPAGVFTTNDGTALAQIGITEVQKNARGIAFGTYQDVQPFLAEGKSISAEGLSILVVGSMPEAAPQGLPTHALRVPAIYRGTNEPIILDVISVQLGDQAVYRKISQEAPELAVFPTVVFRLHVFKDLWTLSHDWSEFVAHPVRSLVQSFPILKLCRNPDCDSLCGAYHPSIEETGVESGLVDVWAFRWMKTDGAKATPVNAEVMSVYFRVPESSFVSLHSASGTDGVFFEPRCQDSPGADPAFSVVWIPQATMPDIMHKVKTHDHCLAACRIGTKYGVRCQAKYQEEVHNELRPQVPFVHCAIKEVYRLEPLPVGTHRQSLSDTLQTVNWKAKPLQPCKGSQGRAWTVGAETPPPSQFIQAKHGWISVAKVKDQVQSAPAQHLIATAKTKQHIGTTRPAASSAQPVDPWTSGRDPWGGYQAVSVKAPAPPSQHVQQKFDDVEQRLQDHIKTTIAQELQDTDTSCRVQHVEQQIQSIIEHQTRLEHWVTEGGTKVTGLQQDCHQLHQAVEQCHHRIGEQGQAINQVATDVSACTQALVVQGQAITKVSSDVSSLQDGLSKTLESYFAKQTEQIESLMAKKARTAWLGQQGPFSGFRRVPIRRTLSFGFFSRLWTFCVFFLAFCRVGEAIVPGPFVVDEPTWALPEKPDFVIGTGNPSGINNKLYTLDCFPLGWFHLAETHASSSQQSMVHSHLRALSMRQSRNIRCCMGAPAPLRSGSHYAGAWTGVLNFADCHLRQVPSFWPDGEYHSGRVMLTVAHIGNLQITSATVYCPAKGPSFPQATELAESLLEPVTEALVFGRAGARIICGDFNTSAGSLRQMQLWQSQGWVELQDLMHGLHSVTPRPTCKGATAPDQIWISPELIPLISNVSVWQLYPDHDVLLAGLRLPSLPRDSMQWHLPGHIPWNHISQERWTSNQDVGSVFPVGVWPVGCLHPSEPSDSFDLRLLDSTSAFREWSSRFEQAASASMSHPTAQADRSFFGRGRMTQPKPRKCNYAVPKHSRPGEVQQVCGFLNRAVARWFKQLRRLQSYMHAVRSVNAGATFLARAALWNSSLHAAGFEHGFVTWWPSRPVKLQGTPDTIPAYPPDEVIAGLLYDDFYHNYRRFESWQLQKRRLSCQSKMTSSTKEQRAFLLCLGNLPKTPWTVWRISSHRLFPLWTHRNVLCRCRSLFWRRMWRIGLCKISQLWLSPIPRVTRLNLITCWPKIRSWLAMLRSMTLPPYITACLTCGLPVGISIKMFRSVTGRTSWTLLVSICSSNLLTCLR